MPLMTQIRNNLTKLFGVLAVFFILFIIFDWGMDLTGRRGRGGATADVIGKINGKEISYRTFAELVRRASENQKKQTGVEVDEEAERQIRSQVWNQLVDETLIEQEIERLGIMVTDQEIIDIVQSPNPPEFLVAQFKDSAGTFHRDAYFRAMSDPQNKNAWIQVEDVIRQDEVRKKLQTLLGAAVHVTDDEVWQRFADANVELEAEYALFDLFRMVGDSSITLTDDDVRNYYDSHPEDFRVKALRKLKYTIFSQNASSDDSAIVRAESERILDQAKSGTDFVDLAKTYSEAPLADAYFKHGELSRIKEKAVFSAKKGAIIGPITDYDGIHIIKVLDEREGKEEFVDASHILLNAGSGPDTMQIIRRAKEIAQKARDGADFGELARQYSQDNGSASQGGELGWTGKGGWVKPFEDAAFRAKVGQIVGPVRTQFGWHIIKVTGKDRRELKIADIALKIKPSAQTIDDAFQRAQDFVAVAKEDGFEKAAQGLGFQVRETPEFEKNGMVPGLGLNDAVSNFAFTRKAGAVSDPLAISGGVGVFDISGIQEEGIRPFEQVKGIARTSAMKRKKFDKLREEAEAFSRTLAPGADLVEAAKGTQNVTAQKIGPFKATDALPGIGRDGAFTGTVERLKQGETSKPFEGLRGYYIVRMLSRSAIDSTRFAAGRQALRDQILQEKRNRLFTEWRNDLREKADIEDHRDKFYR